MTSCRKEPKQNQCRQHKFFKAQAGLTYRTNYGIPAVLHPRWRRACSVVDTRGHKSVELESWSVQGKHIEATKQINKYTKQQNMATGAGGGRHGHDYLLIQFTRVLGLLPLRRFLLPLHLLFSPELHQQPYFADLQLPNLHGPAVVSASSGDIVRRSSRWTPAAS